MQAAPAVAARGGRLRQRGQRLRGAAAQPQPRHAAAQRRGAVGRRAQQQVVAVRGLRVADERVHVGGGQLARGDVTGRRVVARRRDVSSRRLRAPRALAALCSRERLGNSSRSKFLLANIIFKC